MLFSLISFVLFIQDPDPKYFNIEGKTDFSKLGNALTSETLPLNYMGMICMTLFSGAKKEFFVYSVIMGKDNRPTGFLFLNVY